MRKPLVGLSEVKDQGQTGSTYGRVRAGKRVLGVARVDLDLDGKLRESARAAQGAASFRGYTDAGVEHPVVKEAVAELGLKTMDQILDTLFDAAALDRAVKGHDALRSKLAADQWPQPAQSLDLVKDWVGRMNAARIPTYLWDGWQDPAPNERLLYFYNLTVPRRITIGPWSHGPGEPNDPREDAHVKLARGLPRGRGPGRPLDARVAGLHEIVAPNPMAAALFNQRRALDQLDVQGCRRGGPAHERTRANPLFTSAGGQPI
ncbi:MAG: hypothetical protein ABI647_26230, partial [Gemmatimonadota bacterium]